VLTIRTHDNLMNIIRLVQYDQLCLPPSYVKLLSVLTNLTSCQALLYKHCTTFAWSNIYKNADGSD